MSNGHRTPNDTRFSKTLRRGTPFEHVEHSPLDAVDAAKSRESGIEVCVIQDEGNELERNSAWRVLEIWTKNRIYALDSAFTCMAVITRSTGSRESNHPLLGARLSGGNRKGEKTIRLAYPLPLPGMDALFQVSLPRKQKFIQTSRVERVVLRIRSMRMPVETSEASSGTKRHRGSR